MSEITEAAERLIHEAETTVPTVAWINVCVPKPAILLVARYALVAVNDRARLLAENAALRAESQGRLEHFEHSEKSRAYHFQQADQLRAALQEIIRVLDYEQPLGNGHRIYEIARLALATGASTAGG